MRIIDIPDDGKERCLIVVDISWEKYGDGYHHPYYKPKGFEDGYYVKVLTNNHYTTMISGPYYTEEQAFSAARSIAETTKLHLSEYLYYTPVNRWKPFIHQGSASVWLDKLLRDLEERGGEEDGS